MMLSGMVPAQRALLGAGPVPKTSGFDCENRMFYLSYFEGESSIILSKEVSLAPAWRGRLPATFFDVPVSSKR